MLLLLAEVILAAIPSATKDVIKNRIAKNLIGSSSRKGGMGTTKSTIPSKTIRRFHTFDVTSPSP